MLLWHIPQTAEHTATFFLSLHITHTSYDSYILVASPMSLWLLWWPPAWSSMLMVVVMLLMCSVLHCLYSVRNKITTATTTTHDCVIKWKHFPRYWPFVRGIYRSAVNSPHKGQWRTALIFSLICPWITVEQTILRLVLETPLGSLLRHCNEVHFVTYIAYICLLPLSYAKWQITSST